MNPTEEQKIQKILDLLEEALLACKRVEIVAKSLDKALRERLNDDVSLQA